MGRKFSCFSETVCKFPLWGVSSVDSCVALGRARADPRARMRQRKGPGVTWRWEGGGRTRRTRSMSAWGPLSYLLSALWPTRWSRVWHLQRRAGSPHSPGQRRTPSELQLRTPVWKARNQMSRITPTTCRNVSKILKSNRNGVKGINFNVTKKF